MTTGAWVPMRCKVCGEKLPGDWRHGAACLGHAPILRQRMPAAIPEHCRPDVARAVENAYQDGISQDGQRLRTAIELIWGGPDCEHEIARMGCACRIERIAYKALHTNDSFEDEN